MSDPIPADIMDAARKLVVWTFGSTDERDIYAVAYALLSERQKQREIDARIAERCAQDWRDDPAGNPDLTEGFVRNALAIARAIRAQEQEP